MNKEVLEVAEKLRGISCRDWKQLKVIIDKSFDAQKSELENALQLTSLEELEKISQSLFG